MKIDELKEARERASGVWDKAQEGWVRFYVDHPFDRRVTEEPHSIKAPIGEIVLQKGDIQTTGYASTWIKDRDDEYVHPQAFDETLNPFLAKNPMMLWQHNADWPLGKYTGGEVDHYGLRSDGLIPKAEDREPDWKHLAYHSVAKGIVKTHSIGGYMEREFDRDRVTIRKVHLMEISIVSIPANPESIFEAAVKAATGASSRPGLTQRHIQQMTQILGAAEMTDPELLAMNEKQRRSRYDELAAYYLRCGKKAPEYEEWHELVKDAVTSEGLEGIRPVATKTIAFMRRVQGLAPPTDEELGVKLGRTISSKNEDRLRQAKSLIDEILADVGETPQEVDDGTTE